MTTGVCPFFVVGIGFAWECVVTDRLRNGREKIEGVADVDLPREKLERVGRRACATRNCWPSFYERDTKDAVCSMWPAGSYVNTNRRTC